MPSSALCLSVQSQRLDPDSLHRRAALMLASYGHVPGLSLDSGPLHLLLHLLARGPDYVCKMTTLCAALGAKRRTLQGWMARLREAQIAGFDGKPVPLVRRLIRVRLHQVMPWHDREEGAKEARANLWTSIVAGAELVAGLEAAKARGQREERRARQVRAAAAVAAIGGPADARTSAQQAARTLDLVLDPSVGCMHPPTPLPAGEDSTDVPGRSQPPPAAHEDTSSPRPASEPAASARGSSDTGSDLDDGDDNANGDDVAAGPSCARGRPAVPRSTVGAEEHETRHRTRRASPGAPRAGAPPAAAGVEVSDADVEALTLAWDALGLRNRDGSPSVAGGLRESRTLRARLRAGYGLEALLCVIAGAGADPFLRRAEPMAYSCLGYAFCEHGRPGERPKIAELEHAGRTIRDRAGFGSGGPRGPDFAGMIEARRREAQAGELARLAKQWADEDERR